MKLVFHFFKSRFLGAVAHYLLPSSSMIKQIVVKKDHLALPSTPISSTSSARRKRNLDSAMDRPGNGGVKRCCQQIGQLANALEQEESDDKCKKEASIDLLCLAHRLFAQYHSGADATQGNVLFELQTMRVLNRYYPSDNQLVYCGNARNQPDAKQGELSHEFKSRKIDSWDEHGYSLRSSTLIATWQFPDTENIISKMSDPNRRVTYALRCPGETEPVFLLHIHSVAGRLAEIEMYRQLTSNFVTRKQQHSRTCKVPSLLFSSTTYTVNLGRLLSSIQKEDYCIFVYGQRVDIEHSEFLQAVETKTGYFIPHQAL